MQTWWLALAYHINLSVIFDTLTLSMWMTVTSWHFTSSVTHFIYSVFRLYWYWPMWLDKCQWAKSCFTFVAELKSTTQAQRPLFATITPLQVKNKFRWLNCCINYLKTVFSIFCILLIMQEKITSLMQFTTLVWNQDVCMDRIGSFVLSASIMAIITQYISKKNQTYFNLLSVFKHWTHSWLFFWFCVWGFLQVTQFVATI